MADWYAQNLQKDSGIRKSMQKKFGVEKVEKNIGNQISSFVKKAEEFIKPVEERFAPHPSLYSEISLQDRTLQRLTVETAQSIPSMGLAMGVSIATKNPNIGLAVLGGMSGASEFKEAREAGASVEKANAVGFANALTTFVLEKVPFEYMLQGGGGSRLAKIGTSGILEGTEEGSEQVFSNLIAKVGYDKTREWHEGVVQSVLIGTASGGVMGGFIGNIDIQKIETDMIAKGVNKVEIDTAKKQIVANNKYVMIIKIDNITPLF
jgi:hypothetical protein